MIEIVATTEKKDTILENLHYIHNTQKLDSMAKKYNHAIEKFCLPSDEKYFCFRHDDLTINTPMDVVRYKLDKLFEDGKVGVAGLIGTYILEPSCVWWVPNRGVNTAGRIIQGYPDGTTAPMNDWPGTHRDLATVDGCCLFISRKMLEAGIRFDENLKNYHFYDVDICCQALANGFNVSTVDIEAIHKSTGAAPQDIEQYRKVFFDKWSAKIDKWPISRYTKFN